MAEPCVREGLTPLESGELLIDCAVHGEVGRIPAGRREYERAEKAFAVHVTVASGPGRWVHRGPYGGQRYGWAQCRYCGRAQNGDCRAVDCLLCGTTQCHGNGGGDGCCSVCHFGYLPDWSRTAEEAVCGYTGCEESAVATAPRVRRVCASHASRAAVHLPGGRIPLADYATVQCAERDAGRPDWACWRYLLDEVVAGLS